jgi:hypothetical protein
MLVSFGSPAGISDEASLTEAARLLLAAMAAEAARSSIAAISVA